MDIQINGRTTGELVYADTGMKVDCTKFYKKTPIGTIRGTIIGFTQNERVLVRTAEGDKTFSPKNVTLV